jgi:hypothetical protein
MALLGARPVDFLFVDGEHAPGGVRRAFEEYATLVRPGGLVAIHDVRRRRSGWAGEVAEFWAELRGRHPTVELIDPGVEDGYGIGLIDLDARGVSSAHVLAQGSSSR